jgi:FkbM family methyltransferase
MISLTQLLPRVYHLLRIDRFATTPIGERLFLMAFFAYKKLVEDPHAAFAKRRPEVFAGGHLLDVGANVGYTASVFARVVSPAFSVYAFEPEPLNFSRLQRRKAANVVAIQSAVGDEDGVALLLHNPKHPGDHRIVASAGESVTEVKILQLDTFVAANALTPVKFVKMDVQGHELAVCRGMSQVIRDNAGLEVSFEYSGTDSDAVVEFFRDLRDRSFRIYLLRHDGSLTALTAAVPEEWMRRGYCDLFATRRDLQ